MASRAARSLKTYNDKRDFRKTAEPKGEAGKTGGRSYLIQKHAASRLHYDFRLEHDGVLLSWSVPKGPSLDPSDKRLAVRTEDHPIAYGDFEGVIPKGEYGGGTVMLWDRGSWAPEGDVDEGLETGEIKFTLEGERLTGGWALVRMNVERGRENWLLIKERDKTADEERDLTGDLTDSVKTGRSMDQIAKGDSAVRHSNKSAAENVKAIAAAEPRRRTKARPKFRAPQLATLVDEPPSGDGWLHEIKFDGYRVICALGKGGATLYTRNGKDWTDKFAPLAADLERLDAETALIDGEVCVLDQDGRSDFKRLQNALSGDRKERLTLFAFDLLALDGRSWTSKGLSERKACLKSLFPDGKSAGAVRYSDHVRGGGEAFFEHACEIGLEGVISKKADAPYASRRTRSWLKTKCVRRQEFVVGGYSPSEKKGRGVASLLLGVWDGDRLCYAGRVGTGFTMEDTRDWKRRLDAARASNPFADIPNDAARGAVFAKPETVVEVEFLEWTSEGRLRHPAFISIRKDKPAKQIVRETPNAVTDTPPNSKGGDTLAGVRLTHPDKILYPDQGVTKLELAEYYLDVADRILPFLKDRPISLVRCPQGSGGSCFYQRHAQDGVPEQIGSVTIREKEGKGDYLLLDSPGALVAAAQIGALELHPWGARTDDLEKPDMMVFDLDPDPELGFDVVKQAAKDVRGVLDAVGLQGFLKATGGKGLHVVVPLTRRREWPEVKSFARRIAERLAEADASRYVATMAKKKRVGRIFVDYLRNDRGNTAVAPYSTRSRPGAPVATPLRWDELAGLESPAAYTVKTIRRRLSSLKSDPWEGYFTLRQSVTKAAMEAVGASDDEDG